MEQELVNAVAKGVAVYAQENFPHLQGEILTIRHNPDRTVIVGLVGNGYCRTDKRVRRQVESLHHALTDQGVLEVGFGVSDDGDSWALVVTGAVEEFLRRSVCDALRKVLPNGMTGPASSNL